MLYPAELWAPVDRIRVYGIQSVDAVPVGVILRVPSAGVA
jgi:hypothetical protein